MILRRIIVHVRKQEWTAIAIDFLIVVAGVFVGMQVTNWNAARLAQEKAGTYTERLADDLKFEAWQNEYLIAYYKEVRTNAERAIAALSGEMALSDDQLLISAYRASQYLYYGSRRATYEELVATGDIALIADRRLRQTAVTYYNDPTIEYTTAEARSSEYRRLFRRSVPARVQSALLIACGDKILEPLDYDAIIGSLDYPCALDLSAEEAAAAASAFRADTEMFKSLQQRFADLETAILNLDSGNPALIANLRAIASAKAP